MMPIENILQIFLGILGFGLSILFCTTFCKVCSRIREEQIQREVMRRNDQEGRPAPIYFIPFHGNMSQADGEDQFRVPRYSEEFQLPPRYSTTVFPGPPPSYTELGIKPEDLPPAYTEYNHPAYPPPPPPPPLPSHADLVQPRRPSQQ